MFLIIRNLESEYESSSQLLIYKEKSDKELQISRYRLNNKIWVRSFSLPGSTPVVCPPYVRIASTSIQGLTRVSPQCPACGVGHFGVTRGA